MKLKIWGGILLNSMFLDDIELIFPVIDFYSQIYLNTIIKGYYY
jgi:hypothetical protein